MGAESLRELVQTARAGQASRRVHIDALVSAAQQVGWPAPARARWEEAATHLDRPRLWPEAGTSSELGAAIGILSRYVTRKLKWRESDPSTTDAIVEGLGEWVPAKLSQGLEKRGAEAGEALGQVVRLAKDVEEDCPSAHVLQLVGVARKSAVPLPQAQAEVAAAERQRPVEVATASSEQVVTELRAELRRLLPVSGAHGKPDVPALRDALRRRDWSGAKGLAANWLAAPPHKWSHQGGVASGSTWTRPSALHRSPKPTAGILKSSPPFARASSSSSNDRQQGLAPCPRAASRRSANAASRNGRIAPAGTWAPATALCHPVNLSSKIERYRRAC